MRSLFVFTPVAKAVALAPESVNFVRTQSGML